MREDVGALSFFTIKLDVMYNTVSLGGKPFDTTDKQIARWNSALTRPDVDNNAILYHWEGWHADPRVRAGTFSGFRTHGPR